MATFSSDGSASDVQAKINGASNGDTVTIPVGSFTWATQVTITKGIRLQGAGAGRVIARSVSSVAIPASLPSSVTLTITLDNVSQTAATINVGDKLSIERTSGTWSGGNWTGNLPWMKGTVTSFNSGTGELVLSVTSTNYSGTHDEWIIVTEPTSRTIINAGIAGDYILKITPNTTQSCEILQIRFDQPWGSSANISTQLAYIDVDLVANSKTVLIHDCYFNTICYGTNVRTGSNRVLIWNTSFTAQAWATDWLAVDQHCTGENTVWSAPSTMGSSDTTGTNNLYIENCDFHAWRNCTDAGDNAKLVLRYCLLNEAACGSHGADSGPWGARHQEFYQNSFISVGRNDGMTIPIALYFRWRGGTGVIAQNYFTPSAGNDYPNTPDVLNLGVWAMAAANAGWGAGRYGITSITAANPTIVTTSAPHTGQTGQKVYLTGTNSTPSLDGNYVMTKLSDTTFSVPVNVTVSGNAGYANPANWPAPRQVGFGYVTGTGVDGIGVGPNDAVGYVGDQEPIYVWSNTNTPVVTLNNGGVQPAYPDEVSDYIISGREYYIDTSKPGWSAFTYPHPLRTVTPTVVSGGGAGASSPSNSKKNSIRVNQEIARALANPKPVDRNAQAINWAKSQGHVERSYQPNRKSIKF
jgi:hypothetical protein